MKNFIGPKEIRHSELLETKTFLGNKMLRVTFKDSTVEDIPENIFDKIKTQKATDRTTLRTAFVNVIVPQLIAVLLESGIKLDDIEYTLSNVSASMTQSLEGASSILWGKPNYERTVVDVQKILTQQDGQSVSSTIDATATK
jgi:hypothetical protein